MMTLNPSAGAHNERRCGPISLIQAAFPDLVIQRFRFLAEGWDSAVWEANDDLVFRFPKRTEVAAWLRTEIALLPALARALPVPIPHFDYVAGPSENFPYPFVGYRKLPGVSLTDALCTLTQPERVAAQIGALLTALHQFPVAQAMAYGVELHTPETWRDQYVTFIDDLRILFPRLTISERKRTEALFASYLDDPAHLRFVPALLHQDLGGDHVLLDPATGSLCGVIDWGDVTIGDPAQDFCGFPATWLPALLASYGGPVDAAFAARVAFYRSLGPYHALRFGLRVGGEPFIARGLAELRASTGR